MASAWSKPLKAAYTINKALVAQSLSQYVPVGDHSHDDQEVGYGAKSAKGSRVRRSYNGVTKGGWPRQGGRLKHAIAHIPNWHLKDKGRACYNNIFLPYARAVIIGAQIPPVSFEGWKMHWADGSPVFRTSRKGYTIKPNNCLERGLQDFAKHGGASINVSWAKGTDTA